MAAEEVYEKKLLDHMSDLMLAGLAAVADRIRPGWSTRNRGRLEEWRLMLYTLNRSPLGLLGLLLAAVFVVLALLGPSIAPLGYDTQLFLCDSHARLAPPGTVVHIPDNAFCRSLGLHPGNFTMLLGGDDYGRDLWSRILYGARTSFIVAVIVMAVGPWIGIALGLVAGYYGGVVDEAVMRLTDIFLAFPGMILAIAFSAVLPYRIQDLLQAHPHLADFLRMLFAVKPKDEPALASLLSVIIALWLVWWPGYARLARGMVLSTKENTYVEAARALGVPTRRILFSHILPNIAGPLLVFLTIDFGGVILTEAGLSFLGLGAVPPLADWGRIIYDGSQYFPDSWWLVFFPGLMIFLTVFGFNLLGDALRDIMDPRVRRSIEFKVKRRAGAASPVGEAEAVAEEWTRGEEGG
ncbi:ABC transporter permease [Pyrodictium occultum]|uniref:ABC transporter permease n=1 Tax=Pyrodictium occultum TaxID=2309 RepID=UPI0008A9FDFF|nr:ABC transporter permease [Pyrodictium occultum]